MSSLCTFKEDMATEDPSLPPADSSHCSSFSLAGERPPYPWGRGIFRFLKRLFFGAAIYIVLLVLVFVTAVPYGSDGMILLRVSPVLLLLWALASFIPPGGSWLQRISSGKTAEYAAVATLIAILAGVGFSRMAGLRETETQARECNRESSVRSCTVDLNRKNTGDRPDNHRIETQARH